MTTSTRMTGPRWAPASERIAYSAVFVDTWRAGVQPGGQPKIDTVYSRHYSLIIERMKRSTLVAATALALGTALISGVSNFVAKIGMTVVKDPILFTTLKNGAVALLLIGALIVYRRWRELRGLSKRQWTQLVAIGLIGGSVPFALYFTGLTHTSAINASLIHKSLFLWVAVLAVPLLKERMRGWQWLGVALVALANVFVGGFKGFKMNTGELMILGATLLWAVENVIAKVALKNISSLTVASARMVIGSLALIAVVAQRGGGAAAAHLTTRQFDWLMLSSLLLFGYVVTWYAALKRAPATYVATLLVPATLVTNILSAIFVTHAFSLVQFLNGFLLIAGILLLTTFARKTSSVAAPANTPSTSLTAGRGGT